MSIDNINSADDFSRLWLDAQLDAIGRGADKVILLLQAIQKQYNYLPRNALIYLCENSDIKPADVTGVSTFYSMFRHTPAGRHIINVCVGTACHILGADSVYEEFRRFLGCVGSEDTDKQMLFTVNKVACLGCCTLAPAVQIDNVIYGHVTATAAANVIKDFLELQKARSGNNLSIADKEINSSSTVGEIRVCLDSCCAAAGTMGVEAAARETVARYNLPVKIKRVGCVGMCYGTPLIEIAVKNAPSILYARVDSNDVCNIILRHFRPNSIAGKMRAWIDAKAEYLFLPQTQNATANYQRININGNTDDFVNNRVNTDANTGAKHYGDFFNKQKHIVLEHYGATTPLDIDEYMNNGGFEALKKCLFEFNAGDVVNIIKDSGLRGRGGAGFPTGTKWEIVKNSSRGDAYLICNGDEGDPGAFMDRMLLESFPYRIIEGVLIAAYALCAKTGIFYIRAEYPASIDVLRKAINICIKRNIVGANILNSNLSINLSIVEGAGAFVCGEETALIKSIEGKRGIPARKPPYPATCGLYGKPTLVNNCETFACVPWIINSGAAEFKKIGTPKSPGTKVFSLSGKVVRGGLIETPMGITIKEIVETVGGGMAGKKKFKAVQIGGPSGGCIPAELGDTPIDYEKLVEVGAMMGSGGLVALDESDCMVDVARYFLSFTQDQSCGRCKVCRVGTKQMLDILKKICDGYGTIDDLYTLEKSAISVKKASLCGLGKSAPNPVLTTLKYFRHEYIAHINGECAAGKCKALITYTVTEKCIDGCTICSQNCPIDAIPFTPYRRPTINETVCARCGVCAAACPKEAIIVTKRDRNRLQAPIAVTAQNIKYYESGLVYESDKCAKCGKCIGITDARNIVPGLSFAGRGFNTSITAPFGIAMDAAMGEAMAECVATCPTGALRMATSQQ